MKKIIKNSFYNLSGNAIPILSAIICMPLLINSLGNAKFGALTLMWALVGYFSLFDLGIGRSLTFKLSTTQENDKTTRAEITMSALAAMLILGAIAFITLISATPLLKNNITLAQEEISISTTMAWLAFSLPATILTAGFKGILEAHHKFKTLNFIRIPFGLFNFIGPTFTATLLSTRLDYIAATLAIARFASCLVHAHFALKEMPELKKRPPVKKEHLVSLASTGGWMTISNIASPLMGYIDRFVVSALVSSSAVAFYVTPQEMITKLWIIPGALTSVLFPVFSEKLAEKNSDVPTLVADSIKIIIAATAPICAICFIFSEEIMALWISQDFAKKSQLALKFFSIGILINCAAHIPFTLIQSAGKSRISAALHTIELPLYLMLLYILTKEYGVLGTCIAWLIRISLDAFLMLHYSAKILHQNMNYNIQIIATLIFVISALIITETNPNSQTLKWATLAVIITTALSHLKKLRRFKNA